MIKYRMHPNGNYETTVCRHPVLIINLTPQTQECAVCGIECPCEYGLPVWNGMIVANDWEGPWGGVPACYDCWERHERGELVEVPTSDYPLLLNP